MSSTSLVDLLHTYCAQLKEKGRRLQFEILVVFVDTGSDGSSVSAGAQALQKFRDKYQLFSFHRVPVSSAVELRTIDWSALPPLAKEQDPDGQIRSLFEQLPSTTSRADLLRLLIRHLLVSKALDTSCQAILLGHSTTALAELTLAETAKGRGFSLPWQTNDGPLAFSDTTRATNGSGSELNFRNSERRGSIMFYHPLKDVLRKELLTYTTLTDPSLTSLIPGSGEKTNVVVSHKDVSIEEIMVRYFAEVEENYPSVVANVARTMGKLNRLAAAANTCGICAMPRDPEGDVRWRGEIGDDGGGSTQNSDVNLCYGCQRSIRR